MIPQDYLLGYFFGDGSTKNSRGYYQHCFYCNPDDKARVIEMAKSLGVDLTWSFSVKGKLIEVATWPSRKKGLLGLQLLEGSTSYTRRLKQRVDPASFLSGVWDADGCVYFSPRKGRKIPDRKITFVSVNRGLAEDVRELLRQLGIEPYLRTGFNHRGEELTQVNVNSPFYVRFHEAISLQEKKQRTLDLMIKDR